MKILGVITGAYGQRHVDNVRQHGPAEWTVAAWSAPTILPPVVDYPEDFLPAALPPADLILSLAEHRGVAELLPDLATMTGAHAVIVAVDNPAWLPPGLGRQLLGWLARQGVTGVIPRPLCSLTESHYATGRGQRIAYSDEIIAEFARHFGRPVYRLAVDGDARTVVSAEVTRDAVCGCARYVAAGLAGVPVTEAAEQAGLRHHHFPCLASMGIDPAYGDTLLHVSGNLTKDAIRDQVAEHLPSFTPPGRRQ